MGVGEPDTRQSWWRGQAGGLWYIGSHELPSEGAVWCGGPKGANRVGRGAEDSTTRSTAARSEGMDSWDGRASSHPLETGAGVPLEAAAREGV